ncbi:MAG: hypothetical protein Kow0059_17640 [Candidatus Sumerlaeia bacterium]
MPERVGNESVFDELIAPIQDQMIRSIWRIVRHPDDADDAMQDALAMIWSRLGRIRRHPNPQALILRICINCAYDVLRKRIRRERREALTEIDARIRDRRPGPIELAAGREHESAVMEALSRLSRQQATAVFMRIVQGQSYEAVAAALDCSEATARVHVKRGRERLAELLAHLRPSIQPPPGEVAR